MKNSTPNPASCLDERSTHIFRKIVDSYLETGAPVGSRNISRDLPIKLSPASVRNVMSDLEELGLISAPHTSAGRMPTDQGLRMFVDGLLEVGTLPKQDEERIRREINADRNHQPVEDVLTRASDMLSGLSSCAGVVLADQQISTIRQIEFVQLEPGRALVVMVGEDGNVENRIMDVPAGLTRSDLQKATNYLNATIAGKSLRQSIEVIQSEIEQRTTELNSLSNTLIEKGIALWSGDLDGQKSLIVRGRANLLDNSNLEEAESLVKIQKLFDDMEDKNDLIKLLGNTEKAEGMRIFIGAENQLFSLSGSSMIIAPFEDHASKIVGVLGVIGPTRLNYAKIIPMVNYTAKLIGKVLP